MRPDIATAYLEKSFDLYYELGLHNEADKARIIAGISKGMRITRCVYFRAWIINKIPDTHTAKTSKNLLKTFRRYPFFFFNVFKAFLKSVLLRFVYE